MRSPSGEEFIAALRRHRSANGGDADLAEVFPLAAILAADRDPVVHLAVGIALKHAGARDPRAVQAFLDEHAAEMPRSAVRSVAAKLP